ncbi:MAG: 4-hydroxy-3-methylbut-2-enyl diphosphate reductase [Chitinophagaceae bacterium]
MKQFSIPNVYRSNFITSIKNTRKASDKLKKDFSPTTIIAGNVHFHLARHFGFCYGVENAIEIAFKTIEENSGKRIYLLSEMIHNPQVNEHLQNLGVQFLQDTYGKQLISFDSLTKDDVVIIPAFGTTLAIEKLLTEKGIAIEKYNTTCPFVEKVWNRGEQIAKKGFSIVVHGKPQHEETRATFSHASIHTPTVVVNDMTETIELGKYITGEKESSSFYNEFKGRYSEGFDVEKDLQKIGVINQTTQLATDTQAISDYLKQLIVKQHNLDATNVQERFADTRDTLCYATNDNQTAVKELLQTKADAAFIIGGSNSSNSSHLVELCEAVLPSYFIDNANKLLNKNEILNCNWRTKELTLITNYLPQKEEVHFLITSGASCPDTVVEEVLNTIANFYNVLPELEQAKTVFN